MQVKISVVIPVKDRAAELRRAIESVVSQTYKVYEVIVVDDYSDEYFYQQIKAICAEYEIVQLYRNEKNNGAPYCRNFGVSRATGNFIAFLDSDDRWDFRKVELQVQCIQQYNLFACFTLFNFVYPNKTRFSRCKADVETSDLLYRNILGGSSSAILSIEAFNSIGGFDESLKSCQDWDLWLRLTEKLGKVRVVQEFLVDYYFDNDNRISRNLENVRAGHIHIFDMIREKKYICVKDYNFVMSMQKIRLAQIFSQKFGLIREPIFLVLEALKISVNYKVFVGALYVFFYISKSKLRLMK